MGFNLQFSLVLQFAIKKSYCGEKFVFFIFLSDKHTLLMLVHGQGFEGTVDYEVTERQLRLCTGTSHTSCITHFRPVVFPNVYKLLLALHNYNLCCF